VPVSLLAIGMGYRRHRWIWRWMPCGWKALWRSHRKIPNTARQAMCWKVKVQNPLRVTLG